MLQCVAVCYNVLQCVAVCCGVLRLISMSRLSTIHLNFARKDVTAFANLCGGYD